MLETFTDPEVVAVSVSMSVNLHLAAYLLVAVKLYH
jgi:hypothetical protein